MRGFISGTQSLFYFRKTYHASGQDHHAHITIPQEVWNLIWKVKIPLKIGIIVRKDILHALFAILNLCNRGINVHTTCPLCNSEDESTTHLFLYCPFARAIWHGSSLGILTSVLKNVSVQGWVGSLPIRHKRMDQTCKLCLLSYGRYGTMESGGSWR